jgi:hypothetical protein
MIAKGLFVSTARLKAREILFCTVTLLLYTPHKCYFTKWQMFTKLRTDFVYDVHISVAIVAPASQFCASSILQIIFIIGKKVLHLGEIKWQNINTNVLINQSISFSMCKVTDRQAHQTLIFSIFS